MARTAHDEEIMSLCEETKITDMDGSRSTPFLPLCLTNQAERSENVEKRLLHGEAVYWKRQYVRRQFFGRGLQVVRFVAAPDGHDVTAAHKDGNL